MASSSPLSLDERRRRRDARRGGQPIDAPATDAAQTADDQGLNRGERRAQLLGPLSRIFTFLVAAAVDLVLSTRFLHPPLAVTLAGVWAGLLLGTVLSQALLGDIEGRWQFLALGIFAILPFTAVPAKLFVQTQKDWLAFGLAVVAAVGVAAAVREAMALVPRLRRDAEQEASDFPGLELEWALLAALVGLGLAALLASWERRASLPDFGVGLWAGAWLGALVAHAGLRRASGQSLGIREALFAGLPLVGAPVWYVVWRDHAWLAWGGAVLASAALAAAVRLALQLRLQAASAAADEHAPAAETPGATGADGMGRALNNWFHDALMRALAGLCLVAAGALAIVTGQQRYAAQGVWLGVLLIALAGTAGRWTPGLYRRGDLLHALRSAGAICFWFCLLVLPFVEVTPPATLPFTMWPSVRFIGLGLGLALVGGTWYLQEQSLLSHGAGEAKHAIEGAIALILLVIGLAGTLGGVALRQRDMVRVTAQAMSEVNVAGSSTFQPIQGVRDVRIVQPLGALPIYTDYVDFNDGTTYRVDSQVFPPQEAFISALRAAGALNSQSFPAPGVELWGK
ncbi:MAG TPA: hypothetical protein VMW62_06175 [Chloroflexota bacterium]|nr:hypothetical protein [Chloroflexota bacterium]